MKMPSEWLQNRLCYHPVVTVRCPVVRRFSGLLPRYHRNPMLCAYIGNIISPSETEIKIAPYMKTRVTSGNENVQTLRTSTLQALPLYILSGNNKYIYMAQRPQLGGLQDHLDLPLSGNKSGNEWLQIEVPA